MPMLAEMSDLQAFAFAFGIVGVAFAAAWAVRGMCK